MRSPCCNAECWDVDCFACATEGENEDGSICEECDGHGYISGYYECSVCGDCINEYDLKQ